MIELFRKKDIPAILLFVIAVLLLVWFFTAKLLIFYKLGYQSDLYSHLGIARGWLTGRPVGHENQYGDHTRLHNYYFDLLMGPFALWWGAYGIFIFQFIVYLITLWYTFPVLYKAASTIHKKAMVAFFYIVIFCGPIGFFLYDNPHYGFHVEMMYIPLGFMFAISLYKKQTWVSVLTGILMVSTKEDGPVIAACIHLMYLTLEWITGKLATRQWLARCTLWGLLWVAVFIAGLLYIKARNGGNGGRVEASFETFYNRRPGETATYFSTVFRHWFMLQLPLFCTLLFFRVVNWRIWAAWLAFSLPVIAVNLISGFVYWPHTFFSITWVPRFSLTFALYLSLLSYCILFVSRNWFRPKGFSVLMFLLVGALFLRWQYTLLQVYAGYALHYSGKLVYTDPHPDDYYKHWAEVKRVRDVLPDNYPVSPPNQLFGYFHKQDYIWTGALHGGYVKPRMIIIDETNAQHLDIRYLRPPVDSVITEKVKYYFVAEDRHYLIEAGITER
ncbi:MAG TPA: hypothetical protein VEC12_01825 [Bacteroidia bacterium]|nr:hypothetical protein [Bacteroidia bacterium]